jgi:hypothetical protein
MTVSYELVKEEVILVVVEFRNEDLPPVALA